MNPKLLTSVVLWGLLFAAFIALAVFYVFFTRRLEAGGRIGADDLERQRIEKLEKLAQMEQ